MSIRKFHIVFIAIAVQTCLAYFIVRSVNAISAERNYDSFFNKYHDYSLEQLSDLGWKYLLSHQSDSAMACYAMMAKHIEEQKDKKSLKSLANVYNALGYILLYEKGDNNVAYSYLLKAKDIGETNGFDDELALIYLNLGNIFLANDEKSALDYFMRSLRKSIADNNNTQANVAFLNMLNIAISLNDSTLINKILSSYNIPEPSDKIPLSGYVALTTEGARAFVRHDWPTAEEKFMKASVNVDTDIQPERYLLQSLGNLAEVYRLEGKTEDLLELLSRMEMLCSKWNVNDMKREIYRYRAEILHGLGKTQEAEKYDRKHLAITDSLYSYRRGYELKNIENQHEIGKMNARIEESDRVSRQRLFIIVCGIFVIVVLGIFIIMIWRQKKRVDALLLDLYARHQQTNRQDMPASDDSTPTDDIPDTDPVSANGKYRSSRISESEKTAYAGKIKKTLQESDEIFSPGFSIERLSDLAGIPTKTVSRIINEVFGMNFNAFLNNFRIVEAGRRLESEKYDRITIDALSEELGFRNRSHFAAVFKASTGMSPSDFRRAAKLKRMSDN